MIIRDTTPDALEKIAECHKSAFPDSLSSALGKSFLMKMLEWYLLSDDTFLFYIEIEGRIVGYCGGMVKHPGKSMGSASGMAQHSFTMAVQAFLLRPWLVFHKELRRKYKFVLRNVRTKITDMVRKSALANPISIPADVNKSYVALIVVGVSKDYQGKGLGSTLLVEFESRARTKGFKKLSLTVQTKNEQAITAYKRNGWYLVDTENQSTKMAKDFF